MTVRDWPEAERPRERLLRHGPQTLSEAELLAVFLRIGLPGRSVLDLARGALERFGSLNGLLAAPRAEVESMPGFGPAKYAQLQAVIELARRALHEDVRRDRLLDSPQRVREYLRMTIGRVPHEVFAALFLDAQNRLIDDEVLFRGTLTQTSVYPREVVKHALRRNCAAVILAHNHPSGLAEPSRADDMLTKTLRGAGAGRRSRARPPDRCRQRERFVRRARTAVGPSLCRPASARGRRLEGRGRGRYTPRLSAGRLRWLAGKTATDEHTHPGSRI